ncbi:hypothetical protein BJV77DRAFT_115832 [Russula vinacea]|nr:hypothetical protein BJV77DRAFT_115832 [Russula vinacea]
MQSSECYSYRLRRQAWSWRDPVEVLQAPIWNAAPGKSVYIRLLSTTGQGVFRSTVHSETSSQFVLIGSALLSNFIGQIQTPELSDHEDHYGPWTVPLTICRQQLQHCLQKGPLPQPSKNSSILADKEPIECFQDKGWGSYPKPPFVLHRDRTCLRLIPSDRWNYRHPCPRPRRYSASIWGARVPARLVHGDLYHLYGLL